MFESGETVRYTSALGSATHIVLDDDGGPFVTTEVGLKLDRALCTSVARAPLTPPDFRDVRDGTTAPRGEFVEQEARAEHDIGGHESDFHRCREGCWRAAEQAVAEAIVGRTLVREQVAA